MTDIFKRTSSTSLNFGKLKSHLISLSSSSSRCIGSSLQRRSSHSTVSVHFFICDFYLSSRYCLCPFPERNDRGQMYRKIGIVEGFLPLFIETSKRLHTSIVKFLFLPDGECRHNLKRSLRRKFSVFCTHSRAGTESGVGNGFIIKRSIFWCPFLFIFQSSPSFWRTSI